MSTFNTRVVIAGLMASIVMGMLEMIFEAFGGAGFWSPVVFIAATIVRDLQSVPLPVNFQALPVVLGLMGHMMNSVILGVVFALVVAPRLRGTTPLMIGGMLYGLVVLLLMWFAVVPLVDPVMHKLNPTLFAVSHLMWGAALGLAQGSQKAAALVPQQAH